MTLMIMPMMINVIVIIEYDEDVVFTMIATILLRFLILLLLLLQSYSSF